MLVIHFIHMKMSVNVDKFYFFNWEFIPSTFADVIDVTQGNECLDIIIRDMDGCRPPCRYTLPIVQAGQSFAILRANLLYPKDSCSKPLRHVYVSVRVFRGLNQQPLYMNDCILLAPYYGTGSVYRIPIHRIWSPQDYVKVVLGKILP